MSSPGRHTSSPSPVVGIDCLQSSLPTSNDTSVYAHKETTCKTSAEPPKINGRICLLYKGIFILNYFE